ncbi:type I-E CRISPR-associated endoribonuclease Cas2e [Leptospira stimsonii]|nr:type I-E CRISPR-associated endoribonuclease Cas2e [Leptospira stimsonii]
MSRLTLELKAGVYAGNINRRVREKLWEKIITDWKSNALMIYTTNNEQGYAALSNGDTTREIVEIEGMILTQFTKTESPKKKGKKKVKSDPFPISDGG